MKILALSGWKQSGKDTLASYLIEKWNFRKVSFADPLKDMVAEEYGIDRASLDDPERKEKPLLHLPVNPQDGFSKNLAEFLIGEFRSEEGLKPNYFLYENNEFLGRMPFTTLVPAFKVYWTPRALAILKGSVNRTVTSDYWVQQAIKKINEINGPTDQGPFFGVGAVISDLRYKSELKQLKEAFGDDLVTIRIQRFFTSASNDPSERDLDDANFDYFISNHGTKEEAFAQIDQIIEKIYKLK